MSLPKRCSCRKAIGGTAVQTVLHIKACGYTYSGCWKVYGDPQKAMKLFESYKKCTEIYCAQWAKGVPLETLAVAG